MKFLFLIFALVLALTAHAQLSAYSLFSGTADKNVANTVTETSIMPTGVGSVTLPAGFLYTGRALTLSLRGYYSTAGLLPTMAIKVYVGSTLIATASASALLISTSSKEFYIVMNLTCRTAGTSGTVMGQGDIRYLTGTAALNQDGLVSTSPATINTAISNLLDVRVTWGTASASNSITITNVLLQAFQ